MYQNSINIILHRGGMGDIIQAIPSIKWLLDNSPNNFYIYVPIFMEELFKAVFPNANIDNLSKKGEARINPKYGSLAIGPYPNSMAMHTAHLFNVFLCNRLLSPEENSLPRIKPGLNIAKKHGIGGKYAVVVGTHTEPIRKIYEKEYIKAIRYLKEQDIEPIIVGKKKNLFTKNKSRKSNMMGSFTGYVNLVDKTSVMELLDLIDNAELILGPDSGPLHLAGLTDTPIIGAFNVVDPELRMPFKKGVLGKDFFPIVPSKKLECRFCQRKCAMETGINFNVCRYGHEEKCLLQFTGETFIEKIKEVLCIK